ncbi:MAG: hypothetical protein RLY72_2684 [Planctomycetota bacterium]
MRPNATSRLRIERQPHPKLDARAERVFRQAVAREMLLARESAREPDFDPNDARWRLATETQQALQGAVLAYEDRRALLALAHRLGIRAFDANLILAIVQDRARRGESLQSAAPTIAVLPRPTAAASSAMPSSVTPSSVTPSSVTPSSVTLMWVAAIAIAMLVDSILIAWIIFS